MEREKWMVRWYGGYATFPTDAECEKFLLGLRNDHFVIDNVEVTLIEHIKLGPAWLSEYGTTEGASR